MTTTTTTIYLHSHIHEKKNPKIIIVDMECVPFARLRPHMITSLIWEMKLVTSSLFAFLQRLSLSHSRNLFKKLSINVGRVLH